MKKALFVISIYHYGRETWPVLEYFGQEGFNIHVLVGFKGAVADGYCRQAISSGFTVHHVPDPFKYGDIPAKEGQHEEVKRACASENAGPVRNKTATPVKRYAISVLEFWLLLKRLWRIERFVAGVLAAVDPDVVFGCPFHSCGMFDEAIAKLCHRRIPYCCLPVSAYIGEKNATHARFDNMEKGMLLASLKADYNWTNKYLARLFPIWTRRRGKVRMFMFPPVNMLAARIMGFLQKNPWQVPSRFYDVVFVESEFSRKMLEDSNYDLRKVVVAGKPLLDSVGERLYDPEHFREMCRNLGLGEECGFVLVNVEPAAEHHYASWERHWQLFDTVMRSLERVNRKVVLSLHPLCDYENYRFVEQKFGYRISRQYKIMELYPYCDFVVSFACSTNTLALIFKKRLVIYDWFGMTAESAPRGHLFRIPGALYAYTGSELSARIDEVVKQHSPHRREDLGDLRLQACANIYNYVCGKFAYRGKNRGVR